ncbi:MAG: sulfite exporter TauE/SafE family protein [bacterium]|jgi:uncharacterized membrane protein YfcA
MDLTAAVIIYSIACVFAAGCLKGLTGFGLSLVATALLVQVAPPGTVVPVVLLLNCVVNAFLVYGVRDRIDIGRIWPLIIGGVAGLPLGTYILVVVHGDILRIAIGVVILLFSGALIRGYRRTIRRERLGAGLVGAASGVIAGSVSMGGPPVVLFFAGVDADKHMFRANLVAYFLCLNLAGLPMYYAGGLLTADVFRIFAMLLPALILGGLAGTRLLRRVSERTFRRITLAIVMAAAVLAILNGLRGLL